MQNTVIVATSQIRAGKYNAKASISKLLELNLGWISKEIFKGFLKKKKSSKVN